MQTVHDWKIRTKTAVAFGLVLLVTLGLGLFAVQRLGRVHDHAAEARENWFPATRALGDYAFHTMRVRQMEAVVITAPEEVLEDELRLLSKIAGDARRAWARYDSEVSGEARALVERIAAGWDTYMALDMQLRELATGSGREAAFAFYAGEMRRAYAVWRDGLEQLLELQMREGDRSFAAGHAAYVSARLWIYSAVGLAVALSALAGIFIVGSISRPIRGLTLTMNRLSTGDLTVAI